jgi:hypothetical protein
MYLHDSGKDPTNRAKSEKCGQQVTQVTDRASNLNITGDTYLAVAVHNRRNHTSVSTHYSCLHLLIFGVFRTKSRKNAPIIFAMSVSLFTCNNENNNNREFAWRPTCTPRNMFRKKVAEKNATYILCPM